MMKIRKPAGIIPAIAIVLSLYAAALHLEAATVGQLVDNVSLFTSNNQPGARIPDLGSKVLAVFYTDPDQRDLNEPLRDFLKAKNYPKESYRGMGVANLRDTWMPNAVLRTIIRQKERKFGSVVLTDPDHILRKAWGLGETDERDIVILVGKDRKILYLNTGPVRGDEIRKVADIIDRAIAGK